MHRRDAIKIISRTLGYSIAGPTLVGLLSACNSETSPWKAQFLNADEKYMLTHMVDIILPTTDTPGAQDLNLVQFIDSVLKHTVKDGHLKRIRQGSKRVTKAFEKTFDKPIQLGTKTEFQQVISSYFDISKKEEEAVFLLLKTPFHSVPLHQRARFVVYQYLTLIRSLVLLGYCTEESIQENHLDY